MFSLSTLPLLESLKRCYTEGSAFFNLLAFFEGNIFKMLRSGIEEQLAAVAMKFGSASSVSPPFAPQPLSFPPPSDAPISTRRSSRASATCRGSARIWI